MSRNPRNTVQLKISLRGVTPPVWRRVAVNSTITLALLHEVIQTAMGWTDSHLHIFTIDGRDYGSPGPFDDWPSDTGNEVGLRLSQIATAGVRFRYDYDFGDNWEHDVVIEKVEPGTLDRAICLTGRRACPPEDCGGPWGYLDLLAALADPAHRDHEHLTNWAGPDFDPAAFDKDQVNKLLAELPSR